MANGVQFGIQGAAHVSVEADTGGTYRGTARQAGELEEILFVLQGAVDRLDSLSGATEGIISTPKVDCAVGNDLQSLQETPMIMGDRLSLVVQRLNVIADRVERTNIAIYEKIGNLKLY